MNDHSPGALCSLEYAPPQPHSFESSSGEFDGTERKQSPFERTPRATT